MAKQKVELITCAAVRLSDGTIYSGKFHGDALETARADFISEHPSRFRKLFEKSEDGFLTNTGRFVNREEAYEIAVRSQQITPESHANAVEDLWGSHFRPHEVDRELGAMEFDVARGYKPLH